MKLFVLFSLIALFAVCGAVAVVRKWAAAIEAVEQDVERERDV